MKIRVFEVADTEAVVSLWKRCELVVPWNDPYEDIKRKLKVGAELFLVGESEGEVVGSAMGGYDGHRGWVYYLAVSPDHRNKGWGAQLMEELEAALLALGCPKLNLQIRSTNQAVIDFYSERGFKPDHATGLGKRLIPDN